MAQNVIVQLVDDLDGTTADDISTVTFGVDGAHYEIDLTDANANRLRATLADFVAAARRTGGRRTTTRRQRRTATATTTAAAPVARSVNNREHTRAVRDWARQNGFDIADRGRIPTNVVDAFEAAHNGTRGGGSKKKAKTRDLASSLSASFFPPSHFAPTLGLATPILIKVKKGNAWGTRGRMRSLPDPMFTP
jgi:hypothetical protein